MISSGGLQAKGLAGEDVQDLRAWASAFGGGAFHCTIEPVAALWAGENFFGGGAWAWSPRKLGGGGRVSARGSKGHKLISSKKKPEILPATISKWGGGGGSACSQGTTPPPFQSPEMPERCDSARLNVLQWLDGTNWR